MKILKTLAFALAAAILLTGCGRKEKASTKDIWTAVAEGDVATVTQYLGSGGDVDAKEPQGGGTPLIVAALVGQTEIARLLIENGADMEAKNSDNTTAMYVAAFFCQPGPLKALIENGASTDVKNQFGQTALELADMEWNPQMEQIYQAIGAMLQMDMDLDRIKSTRPEIARILREHPKQ